MKKILLVCNAGISTSILVSKMKRAAADEGMDVSIEVRIDGRGKRSDRRNGHRTVSASDWL